MKEQLVTFETAKLAKEKGFDEICHSFYKKNKELKKGPISLIKHNTEVGEESFVYTICNSDKKRQEKDFKYSSPTQSLLQRWLREKHNIDVSVVVNYIMGKKKYRTGLVFVKDHIIDHKFLKEEDGYKYTEFSSYEDALESILQEALKLLP